jgi:hypothetical protein
MDKSILLRPNISKPLRWRLILRRKMSQQPKRLRHQLLRRLHQLKQLQQRLLQQKLHQQRLLQQKPPQLKRLQHQSQLQSQKKLLRKLPPKRICIKSKRRLLLPHPLQQRKLLQLLTLLPQINHQLMPPTLRFLLSKWPRFKLRQKLKPKLRLRLNKPLLLPLKKERLPNP